MPEGGDRRDPVLLAGRGFLSGKYRAESDVGEAKRGAGVKKYINPKGLGVLKALDEVSKKHNVDNTQVALAWLMQRKAITAPIVSRHQPAAAQGPDRVAERQARRRRRRRHRQGQRALIFCWGRATPVARLRQPRA